MATFEIKMPKLGESITEGTILSWSVKVGDHVQEDDTLFEVSTAKVSAEIPSPIAGKVLEIFFQEGDTVAVGTVVATLLPEDEEDTDTSSEEKKTTGQPADSKAASQSSARSATAEEGTIVSSSEPEGASKGKTTKEPGDSSETTPSAPENRSQKDSRKELEKETEKSSGETGRWYSPIVLQLAKEAGLSQEELDQIPGTGYMGRLSKKDMKEYIERKKSGKAAVNAPTNASAQTGPDQGQRQVSAENTRPEPTSQKESSSDNSLSSSAAPSASQKTDSPSKTTDSPSTTTAGSSKTATGPSSKPSSEDTVVEMDRVRRLIADHMVMSKKVSPHVTSVIEVDVTPLVKWRMQTKDEFVKQTGVKLTYLPAIAEATVKALKEFPQINASVDGYQIILKKHIHMGIAVSLPDGNLIVPVIHDADRLNLNGLATAIDSLAEKARTQKLSAGEIQGGTFTITNFGTFKTLFGTPVINQPEAAILAVGYIEKKPAVVSTPDGDAIAIRYKMYLSLSYDHRIIDGALAGSFLRRIGDLLENWKA